MTTTKPIELQNAITAAEQAWNRYDASIEANAPKEERQQLWNVVNWLEERKGQMYTAWQLAGGTSDIDCVTFQDRRPANVIDIDDWQAETSATRDMDYPR